LALPLGSFQVQKKSEKLFKKRVRNSKGPLTLKSEKLSTGPGLEREGVNPTRG